MKTKLSSLRSHLPESSDVRWQLVIVAGLAAALLTVLYLFRLGSLVPAGSAEQYNLIQNSGISSLISQPLLLAYDLPAYLLQQLPGDPLLMARLASVAVAAVSIGLFYLLARRWYGLVNGLLLGSLFAASSWMLHNGRYAAGYITLTLLVLALLNLAVWANSSEHSGKLAVAYAFGLSLAIFTPGGIWFFVALMALTWKTMRSHLTAAPANWLLGSILVAAAGISATALSVVRDPDVVRQIAGLPAVWPGLIDLGKQAALSLSAFVARGPATPETWLAHTPILDIASAVMLVVGIIFYLRHFTNPRTRLLAAFACIGAILTAINGAAGLHFLVPIVYLVLGGGISYITHQWKKVFPRNPIARVTAASAIGLLALAMVSFHTQRYFVAWRYSPETVQAYKQAGPQPERLPYLIQ